MSGDPTSGDSAQASSPPAGKNQFKCFHCRKVFARRDGDWVVWNEMQVHLCLSCDRMTATAPERRHGGGAPGRGSRF